MLDVNIGVRVVVFVVDVVVVVPGDAVGNVGVVVVFVVVDIVVGDVTCAVGAIVVDVSILI